MNRWRTQVLAYAVFVGVVLLAIPAVSAEKCDEKAALDLLDQGKAEAAGIWVQACPEGSAAKGLVLHALFEGDKAIHHLKKAFDSGNRQDPVLLALADALLWKKDFRTATRVLQEVKDTTSVRWLKVNASKHEFLGEFGKALALYERVIPLERLPWGTLERKAQLLSWNKEFDSSIATYTRILDSKVASEGQKIRCRIQRAEVMAWKKDFTKALEELEIVLQQHPGEVEAGLLKGRIQEWNGEYGMAKRTYQAILKRIPGHEQTKLRLEKVQWAD